jgi:hypothetical protein
MPDADIGIQDLDSNLLNVNDEKITGIMGSINVTFPPGDQVEFTPSDDGRVVVIETMRANTKVAQVVFNLSEHSKSNKTFQKLYNKYLNEPSVANMFSCDVGNASGANKTSSQTCVVSKLRESDFQAKAQANAWQILMVNYTTNAKPTSTQA